MGRSAYGASHVVFDPVTRRDLLVHGTTIHGGREIAADGRPLPVAYHHPESPIGRILTSRAALSRNRRVAVIDLGAGALAWYARPGWTSIDRRSAASVGALIDLSREARTGMARLAGLRSLGRAGTRR